MKSNKRNANELELVPEHILDARLKLKLQRELRLSKGQCQYCSSPQLFNLNLCRTHHLKKLSLNHFMSERYWKVLDEMLTAQNFICTYTGDTLVLGDNASLDHKQSKARHPELARDITNVHWVTKEVNLMKRELSEDEFFNLVAKIHIRHQADLNTSKEIE